jgi:hypothetical protein
MNSSGVGDNTFSVASVEMCGRTSAFWISVCVRDHSLKNGMSTKNICALVYLVCHVVERRECGEEALHVTVDQCTDSLER